MVDHVDLLFTWWFSMALVARAIRKRFDIMKSHWNHPEPYNPTRSVATPAAVPFPGGRARVWRCCHLRRPWSLLVGGFNPSEKYESQLGLLIIPQYMEKYKNVPNQQPVHLYTFKQEQLCLVKHLNLRRPKQPGGTFRKCTFCIWNLGWRVLECRGSFSEWGCVLAVLPATARLDNDHDYWYQYGDGDCWLLIVDCCHTVSQYHK